jgi:flagellar hook-associated protein 1
MGLASALQVGRSGLLTSQSAIEVAGNNLANVATRGYHRQELIVTPSGANQIQSGVFIGRGVQVENIIRRVDEALETRIRAGIADQSGSLVRKEMLSQVESLQNELTGIDLSTHMNDFFNAFGELSNQPLDTALRSLTVQQGDVLAGFIQTLRGGLVELRSQLDDRTGNAAIAADAVLAQVELINAQVVETEGGRGGAHSLRDQRDELLSELAQYLDISTIERESGSVDVYVGSTPLMLNGKSRGVTLKVTTDGADTQTSVVIKADGSPLNIDTGQIGALIEVRNTDIVGAIETLDDFTHQLIFQVNRMHAGGQGSSGYSTLTSTAQTLDESLLLNDPDAGYDFTPQHGSFQLHVTQKSTGQRVTSVINIDLDGINPATDTSLTSLASDINAVSNVTAVVSSSGRLQIDANSADFEFTFSDDTSDVLASLGVNTFFSGNNSFDIGVNDVLKGNVAFVAAGLNHIAGDNGNALRLENLREVNISQLGGISLTDVWAKHVEGIAISLGQANRRVEADTVVLDSLQAQQQVVSGVNADEEAISLLAFQRMFQASARFLSVIDEMMDTIMAVV